MTKMTPEREAEIRRQHELCSHRCDIVELLAEVEQLRGERARLLKLAGTWDGRDDFACHECARAQLRGEEEIRQVPTAKVVLDRREVVAWLRYVCTNPDDSLEYHMPPALHALLGNNDE